MRALQFRWLIPRPMKGSEMANKFEHGDIVRLKSGGPTMTIEELPGEIAAYEKSYGCVWFKEFDRKYGKFREHALVKVEGNDALLDAYGQGKA